MPGMISSQSNRHPAGSAELSGRWWPADILLGFMLSGLFLGPLFVELGGPLFGAIGQFVYWLGLGICPEPGHHFIAFGGHSAVVCLRCMNALGGLTITRFLYGRPTRLTGWWADWSRSRRLAVTLPVLAIWQLDVHAVYAGWWDSAPWVQSATGVLVGLAIGLLIYPFLVFVSRLGRRSSAASSARFS
jgi:uncharacterized membrane protein